MTHGEAQEFIYRAAHDLKAPLTSISNYLSLIAGELDPNRRLFLLDSYAARLQERSAYAYHLVDGLKEYMLIDFDTPQVESVDLEACLKNALLKLEGDIKNKNALIDAAPLPIITGDKSYWALILTHILHYALELPHAAASPSIKVRCHHLQNQIELSVHTNCVSPNPDHIQDLFSPLLRPHGPSCSQNLGLDLALAKKLILKQGGHIWANSAPNQETIIFMRLPF